MIFIIQLHYVNFAFFDYINMKWAIPFAICVVLDLVEKHDMLKWFCNNALSIYRRFGDDMTLLIGMSTTNLFEKD